MTNDAGIGTFRTDENFPLVYNLTIGLNFGLLLYPGYGLILNHL